MSVALSVLFTGLCALVTDGGRAPGQMLLVDAKGVGEAGGVALPQHAPSLVVRLGDLANAETSQPDRVVVAASARGSSALPAADELGVWDLTGTEVRIRVQGLEGTGLELCRLPDGTSTWPQPPREVDDPGSWRDLRFVASMQAIAGDGRIRPDLVADGGARASLPREIASRIYLDAGRLEAGMPSHEVHRGDVYEFRSPGEEPRLRQAMTDTMRWSLEADTSAIVVEIVPVAGGPVKRLVLGPSPTPHALFVSNLPAEAGPPEAHHGASHDEMGALHFGAYYKLLLNEPKDQPMPRLWSPEGRKGTGHGRPAFCGGALFTRY
ncbi:MAG TPA: hypothetical protein VLF95_07910 [Vicinamibacteria bacterium]|nr:hypothetical protein [Vicinamibacteria bacterium]